MSAKWETRIIEYTPTLLGWVVSWWQHRQIKKELKRRRKAKKVRND